MSTTIAFPKTQPLQAASIYTQQTTTQQTGGIDITTLMNLMLPAMVIGMMAKVMSSALGKKKEVKVATTEGTNSQAKKSATAG